MLFLPVGEMMACVTAPLTFPQCVCELACPSLALPSGPHTHWSQLMAMNAPTCCMYVRWQRAAGRSRQVIFGECPLTLASCRPLTQIKPPPFSPSPPSISLHCPLPGTFVFTWSTSQGTCSYLWLSGLAAKCAAPVKVFFFSLRLTPAPQIELLSHFLSYPLNHLPIPYLPIMSNVEHHVS